MKSRRKEYWVNPFPNSTQKEIFLHQKPSVGNPTQQKSPLMTLHKPNYQDSSLHSRKVWTVKRLSNFRRREVTADKRWHAKKTLFAVLRICEVSWRTDETSTTIKRHACVACHGSTRTLALSSTLQVNYTRGPAIAATVLHFVASPVFEKYAGRQGMGS